MSLYEFQHAVLCWHTDLDGDSGPQGEFLRYEDVREALEVARSWWPLIGGGVPEDIDWGEALRTASGSEQELAASLALGEALLPKSFVELAQAVPGHVRPELVVNPSRGLASVPWELLVLPGDGRRVLDVFDVRTAQPATVLGVARHATSVSTDPALYVLDPVSSLAPVLTNQAIAAWEERAVGSDWAPQSFVDRDLLRRTLRETRPSRLVFFGHCVPATEDASATGIMLSDHGGVPGSTQLVDGGRALAAHDLLTDNDQAAGAIGEGHWHIPARVALIACGSGLDQEFVEPLGLVAALLDRGACVVVASRWALPSDLMTAGATTALGLAVDAALAAETPNGALNSWKRTQLSEWREQPGLSTSPAIWASMTAYEVSE